MIRILRHRVRIRIRVRGRCGCKLKDTLWGVRVRGHCRRPRERKVGCTCMKVK